MLRRDDATIYNILKVFSLILNAEMFGHRDLLVKCRQCDISKEW